MRLKRFVRKIDVSAHVANHQDKNECFVARKCAVYLDRSLQHYPMVNDECFKLFYWIAGPDIEEITNCLVSQMKEDDREKFTEELSECSGDMDQYICTVIAAIQNLPKRKIRKVVSLMLQLLKESMKRSKYRGKAELEKNLESLKKMLSLTNQEIELCAFLFITNTWSIPEQFFDNHLECRTFSGRKHLTTVLDMGHKELNGILAGTLGKIGMFKVSEFGHDLDINDDYLDLFQNPLNPSTPNKFFTRLPKKVIPLESHLIEREQTEHVLRLLKEKPETSTNILIYGPQGTGKSSYAYGLARQFKLPAYEIVKGDEENKSSGRRVAITACLNMTNTGEGSLIIVDEADNLLNTRMSWLVRGETQDKGWLNYILETPGARVIWITNTIEGIEESVLRRFAFSIQFRPLNRSQRIQLWDSVLRQNKAKRFLSQTAISHLAGRYRVSAGAMDLAVKKAVEAGQTDPGSFHRAVTLSLDSHQVLLNNGEKPANKDRLESNYSLEGLNAQGNIESMLGHLEAFDGYLRRPENGNRHNMNLLFYGPPGTGKSELARYVANRLEREFICKRASDLLNPYVGMTEAYIREAFREAEREEAILVIDEADSLLFSRDRAVRSWEVSFTNEFLSQMERFRGILICTTNRLLDLDSASIRRFNHKIKLQYLTPEGNVAFYKK
ncbi:MAG: ATP-binding protein, partial [Deltaproteobacteria bacterium]|nr:ATP-binding protein [Deltaproteobacteria bacterium]